jgi:Raf kinase inhibitor-like YbhB/YbcL family protein
MNTTTTTITLASDDFHEGETLPEALIFNGMGCSGGNTSPSLRWSGVPAGTQSLALALHDPDAPTTVGFTHWILFDLKPDLTELEAGAGKRHHNPHDSTHGLNDMGENAYCGPCPPPGDAPHHYHFTLYALDIPKLQGADHTLTYPRFRFMIREHILGQGTISGRYGIPAK